MGTVSSDRVWESVHVYTQGQGEILGLAILNELYKGFGFSGRFGHWLVLLCPSHFINNQQLISHKLQYGNKASEVM